MSNKELETLIRKRGAIKSKVTIFSNILKEINEKSEKTDLDIIDIEQRLLRFENLLDDFDTLQGAIEEETEDETEQFFERQSFEKTYYNQIAIAKKLLNSQMKTCGSDTSSTSSERFIAPVNSANQLNNSIKLPTIQLPRFDGSFQNWLEFRDTYESLINKNSSITEIQKFHYLRAALEGSAAQIIKSLEFSANNYEIAWNTLLERYNNTRLLVHNHVKALFSIEPVSKESAEKLRSLIDTVSKNLRSLEQLDQPTSKWDTLVVYLISTKLDASTAREWENYKINKDVPTLSDLKTFLKSRADLLETLESNQPRFEKRKFNTKGFLSTENPSHWQKCIICNNSHYIQNCPEFCKLEISDRVNKIKSLMLCLNCLRPGHRSKVCRRGLCKKCNAKHHTLIHRDKEINAVKTTMTNVENTDAISLTNASTNQVVLSACSLTEHVLLSTACIQILDCNKTAHTVRALLDSGSQSSFISKALCDRLGLRTDDCEISVSGLNHTMSTIKSRCSVNIQSLHNAFTTELSCFILPQITGNIPSTIIDNRLEIPKNIKLADPEFFKPQPVELLIGADLFWNLICIGQICLGKSKPVLQKTRFGWILAGPVRTAAQRLSSCNFSQTLDIQRQLQLFWEMEECTTKKLLSKEEQACEDHFLKTMKRTAEGRFQVTLPFQDNPEKLGESYDQAKRRFLTLEKKLESNNELRRQYTDFMKEYETLSHMKRLEKVDAREVSYYMPHHAVLAENSLTTKLRVVFDASTPTTTGLSLNNLLLCGPTIQSELFEILVRFRQHTYVIAGDIAKMYRQVLVNPEQRSLQRILWRYDTTEPISVYELNTITYGTTPACFLAVRCLTQLAKENTHLSAEISDIMQSDFYVDDLLSGAETVEEAASLLKGVKDILLQGCFELRKIYSNHNDVLKYVKAEKDANTKIINFGENENTKTLGLTWSPSSDQLMYKVSKASGQPTITKRSILSNISQVFDPLGLLSPCVITAKILLQKLWLEKLSWDEAVPSHIYTTWTDFRNELPLLNELKIERQALCPNAIRIELHGFSDASECAYGGCIYLRSIDVNNKVAIHLLCTKTKVAPLRTTTLPRLELSGALILARLANKITKALRLKINTRVFWSDSTIVLNWLKTSPNKLKTFVGNRVAEIQEITNSDSWRHVPTNDNPADYLSRGVKPSLLQDLSIWWFGPKWLKEDETKWPKNTYVSTNETKGDNELRGQVHALMSSSEEAFDIFKRYSHLTRLIRITALILRFKNNCCSLEKNRVFEPLSKVELDLALHQLVKIAQNDSFSGELSSLKERKQLHHGSKLLSLNPFLDQHGVMRVGGRLQNSEYTFDKKHPIVLSHKHKLAKLLFADEHHRLLHAGPQQLLSSLRERFWVTSGRCVARHIVRNCIICFRLNAAPLQPIMGNLPEQRVRPGFPFEITGVDYGGPYQIKDKPGRGCKTSKAYICLFVCFATKAIHLELVTSLTKDAFLLALRRFVSRRGKPSLVFSDNGTNFVSASSELKDLGGFIEERKDDLVKIFLQEGIDWKFIPPHSPHFGGLWEAGIKSTKHHLKRVLGSTVLAFEHFYTLLVQIEAVLNSRPISALSSSPLDLLPLTPSHFLVGRPLTQVPEVNLMKENPGRLNLFQHLLQIRQHFWTRWSKEYISELQQRTKWTVNQHSLKEDMLVLIKEDHTSPLQWKLGRVVMVHPGTDGISRVATLRTSSGLAKRSFAKICPLPMEN